MKLGNTLLEKISLGELAQKAQSFFPAARHTEILKRIDTSLLLYGKYLINTATGLEAEINPLADQSFADALAKAARVLIPLTDANKHVLLLLPTADFAATSYDMSVMGEKLIRSALALQSHSLIPAYDENLLLAVNANYPKGVAFWFNEREANVLFRAFEGEGIFLSALMPRALSMLESSSDAERALLIQDEEDNNISMLQTTGPLVNRLLTINKADLEQEVFKKQWDVETSLLKGESIKSMASLSDWKEIRQTVKAIPDYSFLPAGAISEEKKISLARKSKAGMAIAACIVLLLFAPFVSNWLTLRDLNAELARVQELTIEPRSLQASIFDLEEEWGAMDEYPDQQVARVLVSLNEVVQSSLSSFSIDKGVIDITGSTDDPAYLVELLAQKEGFYNVGQSANNRGGGSQFGIRMNLSSTDFDAYEEKYPAVAQGR